MVLKVIFLGIFLALVDSSLAIPNKDGRVREHTGTHLSNNHAHNNVRDEQLQRSLRNGSCNSNIIVDDLIAIPVLIENFVVDLNVDISKMVFEIMSCVVPFSKNVDSLVREDNMTEYGNCNIIGIINKIISIVPMCLNFGFHIFLNVMRIIKDVVICLE